LSVVETLGGFPASRADMVRSWEIGRLAFDSRPGVGLADFRACMFRELRRLLLAQPIDDFYGTCRPALARLYRRFGFVVLANDLEVAGHGPYCLVHASTTDVLAALAEPGAGLPLPE
jgi:hypothetical protein